MKITLSGKKLLLSTLLVLLLLPLIQAQTNYELSVLTFNMYLKAPAGAPDYARTLLHNPVLTAEPGLSAAYEYLPYGDTGIKLNAGAQWAYDDKITGYASIQFRKYFYKKFKHSLGAAIGPAIMYGTTLRDDAFMSSELNESDPALLISWFSGELTYSYFINRDADFYAAIKNPKPSAFTVALGYRYWLSKNPKKKKRGACNCPSFR